MSHNTLLMTDHASARTIPALEIKNNDVKAGHAATIGKADPEELFYLQSRGINEQTAKDILVKAFFESLLATIIDPTIRQKISNQLNKCLIRKK
jgi:Fe-S cluster assembly protein SufD